jgi:hypothetical protein
VLRAESYRLLFHSALAGLILLLLSAFISFAFTSLPESRFPLIAHLVSLVDVSWHRIAPPDSGRPALALLLGCTLWVPLNYLILHRNHQIDTVIARKGDALELLMRQALGGGKLVLIRLDNGTDYIGYITSNFNPVFQTEYARILPVARGYADGKAGEPKLTKFFGSSYLSILGEIKDNPVAKKEGPITRKELEELSRNFDVGSYERVIPIKEIKDAGLFET